MAEQDKAKKKAGRPPKPGAEPVPDTFENVVKALVKPIKKDKSRGKG